MHKQVNDLFKISKDHNSILLKGDFPYANLFIVDIGPT
jgi:hypothetical protein